MSARRKFLYAFVSSLAVLAALPAAHGAPVPVRKPKDKATASHAPKPRVHAVVAASESLAVTANRNTSHGMEQTITRKALETFVPGTSVLQVLSATTPGVSFASDDPFGLDTWANTFYIRGYTQSQLGITLDGIPLGDGQFINASGLDINQAVIQDNIGHVNMSQGGGALDVMSITNLGGALQYYTLDPRDRMGGDVSQTFGSNGTYRTFARFESGVLNRTGTKFSAAYARTDAGKWKGAGDQFEQQANFKVVQPLGTRGKVSGYFNYSEFDQYNYSDLSLEIIRKLGQRVDYYYPDYATAYKAALGQFPAGYDRLSDPEDASYYDGAQLQRNYLTGITTQYDLTDRLHFTNVLYDHQSGGDYEWTNPYVTSPSGAPMIQQVGHTAVTRLGATAALQYEIGNHTLHSGVWYEHVGYSWAQRYYSQPVLGQGAPRSGTGPYDDPFATAYAMQFNTNTFQYYLEDSYRILQNLRAHAGFKSMLTTTAGGASYNNPTYTGQDTLPNGSLTTAGAFLPHVSLNWTFLGRNELFFDFAKNLRAYTYNTWQSGNAWGVNEMPTNLKPETSYNYEVGYRYNAKRLTVLVNLYHIDYRNRLATITVGSLVNAHNTYINVGNMDMWGADAGVTVRPLPGLEVFNSFSYNKSTYGRDVTSDGVTYPVAGKLEAGYPQWMYKANASYAFGDARLNFNVNYMSKRYISYVNDAAVSGYWLATLSANYRFRHVPHLETLEFNLGVYNLFNQQYVGGIGGYSMSGDTQQLFAGAPRQIFGSLHARF
ncbi:TonB-dependent receptor [Nguyenibacter vanlangensis]|uniref:TonB-dependent receptor n=1 Tax=Nguyenibacter vanlangensis TaxID=1216886 RepID=UPI002939134A|nr:TonB-dependent receptor [Nguyenibacter vanlangensis]